MIALLLFWFAFSPAPLMQVQPARSHQEQLQSGKNGTVALPASISDNAVAEKIRAKFNQRYYQKSSGGGKEKARFTDRLARFYEARKYQPVWTKLVMVTQLIQAVEESSDDGLNPADYHLAEIRRYYRDSLVNSNKKACYDILLSDAFLTLAAHLRYGKVDPESLDPNWNITNNQKRRVFEQKLQHAIVSEHVGAVLAEFRPKDLKYEQLKRGLARYRIIASGGGWPLLENGVAMKVGVRDGRIPKLRQRLKVSGDIGLASADTSTVYGEEIAGAVRRFQQRNALDADGVVGINTLRTLNIPVERRIEQIRLNLERYRWFLSDLEPACVIVNIAGFNLQYIENNQPRWSTRVIVGLPVRETPVFKADMQYIIFNPQWVIPPTILAKDALPALHKSTSYLKQKKLRIIDRNGSVVNPASVNWSASSPTNFPYLLQQTSGDQGALGRIKFVLPNRHIVYLHDTPTKDLFEKSSRAFSSGCIRVENPVDLAELVLRDSVRWSASKIRAIIHKEKTKTVFLEKPMPVFILYLTVEPKGEALHFMPDLYNRDDIVLKALDKPSPQFKMENCGF